MKKHVKTFMSRRRYASWRTRKKLQMPLAFASLFAMIMVVYGISLIFAATPAVIFSVTPKTLTTKPNETRAFTIGLDPKGNSVTGGSVKIVYDANRFEFVGANPGSGASLWPYYFSSAGVSKAGEYTFNFGVYGTRTNETAVFGTIELKVKGASGTVNTNVTYDAAGTRANGNTGNQLPETLDKSAVTIQGTPIAKPTVNLTLNPASVVYSGSTTVTWSSSGTSSCTNTFGGAPPLAGNFRASNLTVSKTFSVTCTNAGGSTTATRTVSVAGKPGDPPPPVIPPSNTQDNTTTPPTDTPTAEVPTDVTVNPAGEEVATEENTEQEVFEEDAESIAAADSGKKSPPFKAIAAIVAGIGLIGGIGYLYFVRLRPRSKLPQATDLNGGLFDDAAMMVPPPVIATPTTNHNIGSLSAYDQTPQPYADAATEEVSVDINHDEMTEEAFSQPGDAYEEMSHPDSLQGQVTDLMNEQDQFAQTDDFDNSEQPDTIDEASPEDAFDQLDQADALDDQLDEDAEPYMSPADKVAQAALASLAAQQKPGFQDVPAKQPTSHMPKPPEPQWQKHVAKHKAPVDEPKDMFELAAEDPDNFGSTQLAETYGEDVTNHHEKAKKA